MICKIKQMASLIAGGRNDELLQTVCGEAYLQMKAALKDGVEPEQCGDSFVTACAILAVSILRTLEGQNIKSYTAGKVSVTWDEDMASAGKRMERLAMSLISQYTKDDDFSFRGVKS
ncbi:MAG: hypothetical protein IJ072_03300 [Oscillospiraceae bacterium]|nr:hypothetical protein [Oscillospiraceae bacterium]